MTSEEIIAEREPNAIPSITKRARMVRLKPDARYITYITNTP